MNRSCYEATIDKSCEARVVAYSKYNYTLSFWNSTLMKSLLASFPFSNGLGTSLQLSRVKNSVIAIGRMWFLYFKRRLLTQHISEFLQVTPGPFPNFWVGAGDKANQAHFLQVKNLDPDHKQMLQQVTHKWLPLSPVTDCTENAQTLPLLQRVWPRQTCSTNLPWASWGAVTLLVE